MKIKKIGQIREHENDTLKDFDLVQHDLSIKEIQNLHPELQDFDGFFVKTDEGDYGDVIYAFEGNVPNLGKNLYKVELFEEN